MKKLFIATLVAVGALVASCNKEDYYHSVEIFYPSQSQMVFVYADQTEDSIKFFTTDNFTLTSNYSWIIIPSGSQKGEIEYSNRAVWIVTLPIHFQPNTEGKVRTGNVTLNCTGNNDWNISAVGYYQQVSWPHISNPAPAYSYIDREITGAAFIAKEPALLEEPDTLEFEAYNTWTLTDGTFVHPALLSGEKGEQKVVINVEENPTEEERTDVIRYSSNGLTTEITYKQEAKKQPTEE